MTPAQKRILLVLSVAIALTRPLAIAHSLNDWDEGLFSSAIREYDVNLHHPHPPGYPLFIAAGKVVHLLGLDPFRSLQIVVLLGAMFLFPVLVLFGCELKFGFATSVAGALIFTFLPNVWVYGGTGFSDVPSLTLGLLACALLLRGRDDRAAYVLGAVILGVAAGFRIPNLLLGAFPAVMATVRRLRARDVRAVTAAILLGAAVAGGSYLGAAYASGTLDQYRFVVSEQSKYVRAVDSWRNPARPPLPQVARAFLVWPIEQREFMKWFLGLAVVGMVAALVQRRWSMLLPLAIFGPVMIVAWLTLDVAAAGRYSITYLAAHALFVAHSLGVMTRKIVLQVALAAAIALTFAVWAWPALRLQRQSDAPAAAALLWVGRNVPRDVPVYIHGALRPHATYLLPDHQIVYYVTHPEISRMSPDAFMVEPRIVRGAMNFVRPHNAMWDIVRRRNFETAVLRLASYVKFGAGWYPQEGEGLETFRWMGKESRTELSALGSNGRLSIRMFVPVDAIQPPTTVEVWVNGVLVERFNGAEAMIEKSWTLPSRASGANELRIATSAVAIPARSGGGEGTRELGLRVDTITWTPTR